MLKKIKEFDINLALTPLSWKKFDKTEFNKAFCSHRRHLHLHLIPNFFLTKTRLLKQVIVYCQTISFCYCFSFGRNQVSHYILHWQALGIVRHHFILVQLFQFWYFIINFGFGNGLNRNIVYNLGTMFFSSISFNMSETSGTTSRYKC